MRLSRRLGYGPWCIITIVIVGGVVSGMLVPGAASAQTLPEDELQIAFSGYFDNFHVDVLYPSVSLTRRISGSTSLSARYLVDLISAASMRSQFVVEGVTSATARGHGGTERSPDEVRHEVAFGVTRVIGNGTWAANVLYGTEHDYTSATLAVAATRSFADRNTEVQVGVVRSWDDVHPRTRSWSRDKNVSTVNAGLTQVLTRRLLGQVDFTYSDLDGFLSDPYQVVAVIIPDQENAVLLETRHPDRRIRRSVALRTSYRIGNASSLQAGYRYYWDSWDVTSNTYSGLYQQHLLDRRMTLGLGVRSYVQTDASFSRPLYVTPEAFMTVDSRLDAGRSHEYELQLRMAGSLIPWLPGMPKDRTELITRLSYYRRRTAHVDWHSRRALLIALITSVGLRYRF